jgi:ABC-type multidrug transport system fused ATPase/permease subunit
MVFRTKIMIIKKIKNLYSLYKTAYSAYKKQIILLTVMALVTAFLEGIGINIMVPILSYFIKDGGGEYGGLVKVVKGFFDFLHIDFSLKQMLFFVIILFVSKSLIIIVTNYIKIKITTDYETKTKNKLLRSTLKADWPYLSNQKTGYLENTIKIDVNKSSALFQEISTILITVSSMLVYVIIALNISFIITLSALTLIIILLFLFKPIIMMAKGVSQEMVKLNQGSAHHINQSINGIKTVKTTQTENIIAEKGNWFFQKIRKFNIKIFLIKHIPGSLLQPMGLIFVSVLLGLSYKTESLNLAILIPIIYLVERIFEYGKRLQGNLHNLSELTPYLRSIVEYEERTNKAKEKQNLKKRFSFKKDLKFTNLSFRYPDKKDNVLENINLTINKGELIGIIGPSGGGKTTIVDLILRLLKPESGKILLDGQNIDKINLKSWRKNVGYVSQDIFLLNDTIANNINFYNKKISQAEIEEATQKANIYDFIQSLPDKFNSEIGEKGVLLSMGQRQRIVIARTLVRKPKILILDEATSALDSESEVKIQKVIENLKGEITVIAIAHRLSTVVNSDKILVLEDGLIKEQGKPQELLKNKESYFYKVYNIRGK